MGRPPSADKKVKGAVYLSADDMAELRHLSERTLIPVAALLRQGVRLVLHQYQNVDLQQMFAPAFSVKTADEKKPTKEETRKQRQKRGS